MPIKAIIAARSATTTTYPPDEDDVLVHKILDRISTKQLFVQPSEFMTSRESTFENLISASAECDTAGGSSGDEIDVNV